MLKALWNRINKDEQGFTMVELLIVIVILGVLAGIGIPTYRSFIARSHEAATLSELQAVSMAVKYYGVENNSAAPTNISQLNRYIGDDIKNDKFLGTYSLDVVGNFITADVGDVEDRIDAWIYLEDVAGEDDTEARRVGDIVFEDPTGE